MRRLIQFNRTYFFLTILLFVTEVLIALYVHDRIIRPYVGDFLVVMLIYCFIKSFIDIPVTPTAMGVLLFAFTIEVLQYFHIVELLGLQHSTLARTVIGSSFEWIDLIAYTLGVIFIIVTEGALKKHRK